PQIVAPGAVYPCLAPDDVFRQSLPNGAVSRFLAAAVNPKRVHRIILAIRRFLADVEHVIGRDVDQRNTGGLTADSQMAGSGSMNRPGDARLALGAIDRGVRGSVDNDIGPLLPQRVGNRFLPGDVDLGAIDARNPVIRRPHSSAQLMSDLTGGTEHKKFHRETSR